MQADVLFAEKAFDARCSSLETTQAQIRKWFSGPNSCFGDNFQIKNGSFNFRYVPNHRPMVVHAVREASCLVVSVAVCDCCELVINARVYSSKLSIVIA